MEKQSLAAWDGTGPQQDDTGGRELLADEAIELKEDHRRGGTGSAWDKIERH